METNVAKTDVPLPAITDSNDAQYSTAGPTSYDRVHSRDSYECTSHAEDHTRIEGVNSLRWDDEHNLCSRTYSDLT